MRIDMAEVAGTPVLSGAVNGKVAFAELVKIINHEPNEPAALFLDFRNVDTATASYLRESVFTLKIYLRTTKSKYYPVVANVDDLALDEISIIAALKGDVIMSCELDGNDKVAETQLIGNLDPKQKMTFDIVNQLDQVDANSLMEKYGDAEKTKGTTAWNNRLAALVAKGVIREFVQGRSKFYRPLLEEAR